MNDDERERLVREFRERLQEVLEEAVSLYARHLHGDFPAPPIDEYEERTLH